MWGFTELNFRTNLRATFVLCVPFYKTDFAIIYLTVIRFSSIIDVLSYQDGFHLFVLDASKLSSVAWRDRSIVHQCTGIF